MGVRRCTRLWVSRKTPEFLLFTINQGWHRGRPLPFASSSWLPFLRERWNTWLLTMIRLVVFNRSRNPTKPTWRCPNPLTAASDARQHESSMSINFPTPRISEESPWRMDEPSTIQPLLIEVHQNIYDNFWIRLPHPWNPRRKSSLERPVPVNRHRLFAQSLEIPNIRRKKITTMKFTSWKRSEALPKRQSSFSCLFRRN